MPSLLVYKEAEFEPRVALVPSDVKILANEGFKIKIQKAAGEASLHPDQEYLEAGAELVETASDLELAKAEADVVLRINKPQKEELEGLKEGALHLSFLDPFAERELLNTFAKKALKAVSLEMIPRTTIAQKMDVLSSQTSLAGYAAVVLAASKLPQIFPMMMTPSGNITPVRVFVIGVGVAGLQVIATAKRLGARVEAFDTRPGMEEQIRSLGARFVKIDLGESTETSGGYAKELSPEQIAIQQAAQAKVCAKSDIVITTAKVFGRKAPILVTKAMLDTMKAGSILIDMAVSTGGNVEGSDPDREIIRANGVRIIPGKDLARLVPIDASAMFSGNIRAFLEHFYDREKGELLLLEDEKTLKECLLTSAGEIVHPLFRSEAK